MRRMWKYLMMLVVAVGMFCGMTLMSVAADGDIAGGVIKKTYGEIIWRIDKNGHLTVEGWGELERKIEGKDRIPWYQYRKEIVSAKIDVEGIKNASYLFFECSNMTSVDLQNFQTSELTNTMKMFSGCSSLEVVDVSDFSTHHVVDMSYMFDSCSSLEELDVSNFDTSSVENMAAMFKSCSNLKKLDLSNFNTKNVNYMYEMFQNCTSLEFLNVSSFNTENVWNTSSMFENCELLEELDVSSFVLKNVGQMNSMFRKCVSLKNLDVSNFQATPTMAEATFAGCEALTYLDLSTFKFIPGRVLEHNFLGGCHGLTEIKTPAYNEYLIELPYYTGATINTKAWYGPSGSMYYCLPFDSESMILRKLDVGDFWDVYPEEWYAPYVDYVYEKGLMSGNGKLFYPNNPMTRAMVVQTLYNMEGKPTVTEYRACLDLKDVYVDWYTDAVCWAYNEGITTGYDDTKTFEVNKSVTREELAAFLYRYANYKGYDTIQEGDFSGIENVNLVSPYAKNAMSWAVGAGLISGIEIKQYGSIVSRDLAPQGTATRAQMAAILQRFCIAYAEPVIFEWNGHSYAVFDNCQSWEGAKAYCEAKGGYLAVIDSVEENEALYNFMKENGYTSAYFGLSDKAEEGTWRWVTGEEADYANWNADEPGGGTDENYAMFFYLYEDGTWNDGAFKENVHDGGNAYICEWENP